jgi:hypothetical protein
VCVSLFHVSCAWIHVLFSFFEKCVGSLGGPPSAHAPPVAPCQMDFVTFMYDNSTLVEEMVLPYLGPRDCVLLASAAAALQPVCRGGDRLWRQFYAKEFGAGPAVLSTKRGDVSSYYELYARKRVRWLFQCGTMVSLGPRWLSHVARGTRAGPCQWTWTWGSVLGCCGCCVPCVCSRRGPRTRPGLWCHPRWLPWPLGWSRPHQRPWDLGAPCPQAPATFTPLPLHHLAMRWWACPCAGASCCGRCPCAAQWGLSLPWCWSCLASLMLQSLDGTPRWVVCE